MTQVPKAASVNVNAARLVDAMADAAAGLRIGVATGARGERVIDAGGRHPGGIDAGMHIARICMGGLGTVSLVPQRGTGHWPWNIVVRSSQPVIACLGSQYAGWNLTHGEGEDAYFAMGSGPARALARRESLFDDMGYEDSADSATIVLETETPPPPPLVDKLARDCGVASDRLNVIFAPTRSLAGTVQVVARVLEVALHKAHALHFPLAHILDGMGMAPLAPPHPDFVTALGRTNDAIIYGGLVHIFVSGPDAAASRLAEQLPSRASRDYGEPFADIFRRFKGDFYAIDPMLFSPAEIIVTALDSGRTFRAGGIDQALLDAALA